METIAQGKGSPFNLQVMIPKGLKRDLRIVAGDLGVYQRDIVTEALRYILPLKKKEAKAMLQSEAKNGKVLSG